MVVAPKYINIRRGQFMCAILGLGDFQVLRGKADADLLSGDRVISDLPMDYPELREEFHILPRWLLRLPGTRSR
jgi:hypothetical protein